MRNWARGKFSKEIKKFLETRVLKIFGCLCPRNTMQKTCKKFFKVNSDIISKLIWAYEHTCWHGKTILLICSQTNGLLNDTYLCSGFIFSLTSVRSLSANGLQRLSREYILTERGWEDVTKSMSNITLFLRASSSCRNVRFELFKKKQGMHNHLDLNKEK